MKENPSLSKTFVPFGQTVNAAPISAAKPDFSNIYTVSIYRTSGLVYREWEDGYFNCMAGLTEGHRRGQATDTRSYDDDFQRHLENYCSGFVVKVKSTDILPIYLTLLTWVVIQANRGLTSSFV